MLIRYLVVAGPVLLMVVCDSPHGEFNVVFSVVVVEILAHFLREVLEGGLVELEGSVCFTMITEYVAAHIRFTLRDVER